MCDRMELAKHHTTASAHKGGQGLCNEAQRVRRVQMVDNSTAFSPLHPFAYVSRYLSYVCLLFFYLLALI